MTPERRGTAASWRVDAVPAGSHVRRLGVSQTKVVPLDCGNRPPDLDVVASAPHGKSAGPRSSRMFLRAGQQQAGPPHSPRARRSPRLRRPRCLPYGCTPPARPATPAAAALPAAGPPQRSRARRGPAALSRAFRGRAFRRPFALPHRPLRCPTPRLAGPPRSPPARRVCGRHHGRSGALSLTISLVRQVRRAEASESAQRSAGCGVRRGSSRGLVGRAGPRASEPSIGPSQSQARAGYLSKSSRDPAALGPKLGAGKRDAVGRVAVWPAIRAYRAVQRGLQQPISLPQEPLSLRKLSSVTHAHYHALNLSLSLPAVWWPEHISGGR